MLRKLEDRNLFYKIESINPFSRVVLLHNTKQVTIKNESKYYSIFNIKNGEEKYLLFTVHLPSRYNRDKSHLDIYASQVIREFEKFEEENNNSKSIVVGDFNMNPFDEGMVSALSFNAVMCPNIACKESRKVFNEDRKFYYNPMWHLMGNYFKLCKGTFYYATEADSFYWYTYDQVILRPSMIEKFDMNQLKIIDNINEKSLLTTGYIPDKKRISDHLPIIFKLRMEVATVVKNNNKS